jgi:hypothetical protein
MSGLTWPQKPEPPKEQTDQPKSKKTAWLHEIYLLESSEYEFFLE